MMGSSNEFPLGSLVEISGVEFSYGTRKLLKA